MANTKPIVTSIDTPQHDQSIILDIGKAREIIYRDIATMFWIVLLSTTNADLVARINHKFKDNLLFCLLKQ